MRDLDLDELADLGAAIATGGHQHFLLDLRVVRRHVADTALFEVTPDHAFMRAGDDFYQYTFTAATAVGAGHTRQGAVAIEYQAHLRRAEEQVVALVIRDEEAKTVAVAGNAATDKVQLIYRGIGATPGIDKLAVALHGTQAAAQGFNLVFLVQTEFCRQLLAGGRLATIGKTLEDQLTAGDRVVVFFRFASGLGSRDCQSAIRRGSPWGI